MQLNQWASHQHNGAQCQQGLFQKGKITIIFGSSPFEGSKYGSLPIFYFYQLCMKILAFIHPNNKMYKTYILLFLWHRIMFGYFNFMWLLEKIEYFFHFMLFGFLFLNYLYILFSFSKIKVICIFKIYLCGFFINYLMFFLKPPFY